MDILNGLRFMLISPLKLQWLYLFICNKELHYSTENLTYFFFYLMIQVIDTSAILKASLIYPVSFFSLIFFLFCF